MRPLLACLLLSLLAAPPGGAAAVITVTETDWAGQPSYRIATPAGTWIYHREGAGFASLLDAEGHDWIAYRPGGGAAGEYRGIANAVHRQKQSGNNFFHPGHSGARGSSTTLVSAGPDRVLLRSRSADGRWTCEWEILSDRARLRMSDVPADDGGYWFLYEGTPGGRFAPGDLCIRPGPRISRLSERWESTLQETPWVAFVSPGRKHALLLVAHQRDAVPVSYRPMNDAMTVFGFGRRLANLDGLLTGPRTFTVMLLPQTDPTAVAQLADALQP